MWFSEFSILTLFGYLQDDNIVNSYLNILFAIYHHLLFHRFTYQSFSKATK